MPFRWWKKSTKAESSGAPELEKHGLFLLNQVPEPWKDKEGLCDVDIVFVHGLGGHFRNTWTHRRGNTTFFWPVEALAEQLPGARIFSYGYPSGGLQVTRSEAGIRDFAKGLLEALRSERVHKLAIVLARSDSEYEPLWLCTRGIIFLGTPHRGSFLANEALLLALVLNFTAKATSFANFVGTINTSRLELLQKDKDLLRHITDDFLNCLKQSPELKIVSFYETKRVVGLNDLVVNQVSAQLGIVGESFLPLHADHREICRFSGLDHPDLKVVCSRLNELREGAIKKPESRSYSSGSLTASVEGAIQDCVLFLNTVDLSQYSDMSQRKATGTLRWFEKNPQYLEWRAASGSNILWVSGFAGSGKTTLVLHTKELLLADVQQDHIVASFLCDDKDEKQRNGMYMLQTLIYQIVEQCRSLWRLVVRAKRKHGSLCFQRLDGLWQILEEIINSHKRPEITILLDAIDECETKTRHSILERFYSFSMRKSDTALKLFITSRLDASSSLDIRENGSIVTNVWLDDYRSEIAEDISLVVTQTLQKLVRQNRCQANIQELIASAFVSKADKTFLWAKFALKYLEERQSLFRTSISEITSLLPDGLEDVYAKYLSSISPGDGPNAAKLLGYIVACDRPLTTDELSILFTLDSSQDETYSALQDILSIDNRQIVNLLGSLIRIHNNRIYLVHQTLKDYLTSLPSHNSFLHEFTVDINKIKAGLSYNCARYIQNCITFHHVSETGTSSSSSASNITMGGEVQPETDLIYGMDIFQELSTEGAQSRKRHEYTTTYKLFDYAAQHWQEDLNIAIASHTGHAELLWDCAQDLYDHDDQTGHPWFRYLWFHMVPTEPFPSYADALLKAAFGGHLPIIHQILQSPSLQTASVAQALYWAVRYDHDKCVDALISHVSRQELGTLTNPHPVLVAAEFGSLRSLTLLLRLDLSTVNQCNKAGKTPLMLAAGAGQIKAVKFLVSQLGMDLNMRDDFGRTALHWAVHSEITEINKMLIEDARIEVNLQDRLGRTPLHEAAEHGQLDIIKLLLKHETIAVNQQDAAGRTPLSYACGNGHLSVVKRLCNVPEIDPLCSDQHGRVPHSWAASQKNLKVLQFLLTFAPAGADIPDHDGWAPFAWALGPPAIIPNAKLLLETGNIDVNRTDNLHGRPLLNWLASYGEHELMKTFLLSVGLDVRVKDSQGCTPLMDAAAAGQTETILLLLQQKSTDVNERDTQGRTALMLAARGGHLGSVIALAEVPGVRINCKDNDALTALDAATQFQHKDVITVLQKAIEGPPH